VIDLKNSRQLIDQSDAKPVATWSHVMVVIFEKQLWLMPKLSNFSTGAVTPGYSNFLEMSPNFAAIQVAREIAECNTP